MNDDDVPATSDWWHTVAHYPAWYWRAVVAPAGAMFAYDAEREAFGHFHRTNFSEIFDTPTRGQIRTFCRAIGVELK